MASPASALSAAYPWVKSPLIVSAPMLRIALAPLAVSVSRAGGLGFIAGGFDVNDLEKNFEHASNLLRSQPIACKDGILPIGVGFISWGADLSRAIPTIQKYTPAAVWLFGSGKPVEVYSQWATEVRAATNGKTKIWIQLGTVADALSIARAVNPDVLVIQGSDAGGHGLKNSASVISLVPEIHDTLSAAGHSGIPLIAAGGIADGRGVSAAMCLGASGVVMGTRFLAATETNIPMGYQNEVLRACDGSVSTARTTVYDRVRAIHGWPAEYDGRGLLNASFFDAERGMSDEENVRLYELEMKKGDEGWGPKGRMTTYAGTGVGLVNSVASAKEIVEGVRDQALGILSRGRPQ